MPLSGGNSTGTPLVKVDVPNIATNSNILIAPTSVDVATHITFTQTTAGITATLLNPTITTVNKNTVLQNLPTSTQSLTITAVLGDSFILLVGQSIEVTWNGTSWRLLSEIQVAREFGSVIVANQIFNINTFVNSTNGTYAIPSAGTWRLRYDISTDGTGANANSQIQIVNNVGVLVAGTERTRGGNVTSALTLTAEVIVTTTSATTYTLQGRNGGSGSITVFNTPLNTSSISWEKISGFSAVTGQISDFKTVSGWNVSAITVLTDAVFTNIGAGNIPYSAGLFTLTAGKTYEITGHLEGTLIGNTGTDWQQFILCDSSNTQLPNSPTGIILGTANSNQWQNTATISTIFTPTVTTQVKLRLNNRGSSASFSTNASLQSGIGCWMTVRQIGSSSWTGLNLTTTGSGAANYNSSTSTLNIPTVTGKILILNTGNLTGVLNGVTFSSTWADPISLTTSSNMTGFISSEITIQSNTVNIDAWLTGLSSGTGARLQRWKNVQSATNITFGLYSSAYSCNYSGFVTIGAFEYKISGYTHGGVLNKMYIELMQ